MQIQKPAKIPKFPERNTARQTPTGVCLFMPAAKRRTAEFNGNAISVSYNGSVGQVFYQEQPFWASDDINVLILKKHILTPELYGYLGATLKKAGTQFSYSYKWNTERMKATVIHIPIQIDSKGSPVFDPDCTWHPAGYIPDWDYMEKYIRAVEKLVIADVVKWKDEEIARTREIVTGTA